MERRFQALLALVALAACGQGNPSVPGVGDGTILDENKKVHFRGTVVDRATNAPLAATLIAIESGGILQGFPDTSKASPYYQYGGLADQSGNFDIELPPGTIGVHAFADGYVHGRRGPIEDLTVPVVLHLDAIPSSAKAESPIVSSFDVAPVRVAASASLTVSADVAAGSGTRADPLSDNVFVFEPLSGLGAELDPPRAGDLASGYPDGRYARTFRAPSVPGTYTYYLVTASELLITSPKKMLTVTVTP